MLSYTFTPCGFTPQDLCLLNKDKSAFVKLEVSGVKIGWRTAAGGKESYNKQVKFFRIMPMNTI
jgi:hypothetical protein